MELGREGLRPHLGRRRRVALFRRREEGGNGRQVGAVFVVLVEELLEKSLRHFATSVDAEVVANQFQNENSVRFQVAIDETGSGNGSGNVKG